VQGAGPCLPAWTCSSPQPLCVRGAACDATQLQHTHACNSTTSTRTHTRARALCHHTNTTETKDTPDAPAAAKKELEKLGPMSRWGRCARAVCVCVCARVRACCREQWEARSSRASQRQSCSVATPTASGRPACMQHTVLVHARPSQRAACARAAAAASRAQG
jgi:hypothetical protein